MRMGKNLAHQTRLETATLPLTDIRTCERRPMIWQTIVRAG